jgi:hypothetical protein
MVIGIQADRNVLRAFPQIRECLRTTIEGLPLHSRIILIGFGERSERIFPPSDDKQEVEGNLERMLASVYQVNNQEIGSATYEAILQGVDSLTRDRTRQRRRAVVIFAGELPTHSKIKMETVSQALQRANATLFAAIAHPTASSESSSLPPYVYLPPKPMDGSSVEKLGKRLHPSRLALISPLALQSGGLAIDSTEYRGGEQLTGWLQKIRERYLILFTNDAAHSRYANRVDVRLRDLAVANATTLRYRKTN